jgi:hypothetical protein
MIIPLFYYENIRLVNLINSTIITEIWMAFKEKASQQFIIHISVGCILLPLSYTAKDKK